MCSISSGSDPISPLLPVSCLHFVCLCVCSLWKSIREHHCPPNWSLKGIRASYVLTQWWMCRMETFQMVFFCILCDMKSEEAFSTNTTMCVTWNCHFPRKWMCWGWDEEGTGMLQSWLGGCWTAVGRGCCLPGEMDSEGEGLRSCSPAGAAWTRPVF